MRVIQIVSTEKKTPKFNSTEFEKFIQRGVELKKNKSSIYKD